MNEERQKLRGEGFGKRFSKKWWSNIWYYYRFHFLAILFIGAIVGYGIYDQVTKIEPDISVDYFGYQSFTEEQLMGIHNFIQAKGKDINGDGKVSMVFYPNAYSPSAKDEQSLGMGQKLDLEIAAGEPVIFLFDKPCFDLVTKNQNYVFLDLSEWAKEFGIPEEQLVKVNEQYVGVKLNSNKMLTESGIDLPDDIDDKDNVYMVVRGRRYNEDKGVSMERYDYSLELARYILSSFN